MNRHLLPIEPQPVVEAVDEWVRKELADARKYDNRTLLDESGIYTLHALAADIYALAWDEATRASHRRADGARGRHMDQVDAEREAQRKEATPS